jgi:hypothetical protein
MAHFAKLGKGNKVLTIHRVHNNIATTEQAGVDFLNNLYKTNDVWKQTSYNTRGNVHYAPNSSTPDDGFPLRKNYAGKGYTYDEAKDAFIPPKPYSSWILNDDTCNWEAPVAYPDDGRVYIWNEGTISWDLLPDDINP